MRNPFPWLGCAAALIVAMATADAWSADSASLNATRPVTSAAAGEDCCWDRSEWTCRSEARPRCKGMACLVAPRLHSDPGQREPVRARRREPPEQHGLSPDRGPEESARVRPRTTFGGDARQAPAEAGQSQLRPFVPPQAAQSDSPWSSAGVVVAAACGTGGPCQPARTPLFGTGVTPRE